MGTRSVFAGGYEGGRDRAQCRLLLPPLDPAPDKVRAWELRFLFVLSLCIRCALLFFAFFVLILILMVAVILGVICFLVSLFFVVHYWCFCCCCSFFSVAAAFAFRYE